MTGTFHQDTRTLTEGKKFRQQRHEYLVVPVALKQSMNIENKHPGSTNTTYRQTDPRG